MQRVPMQNLIDFGASLLVSKGVRQPDAQYIARIAADAEAFGITTHGLVQLGAVISQIPDPINPAAEPKVVKDAGAIALIDGDGAIGQLSMRRAKELALAKAQQHGVAFVGVASTSWIAAMSVYLIDLAEQGFFAQLYAQSSQCQDCAPFGGIDPRLSTNPMALAFPTPGDPVVADFSTAAVSMGKVNQLTGNRQKAHAEVFMDNQGNVTDDPRVVRPGDGQPPGSILFAGQMATGHKVYALSLWCEAMTAMVGGNCNNPDAPQRQTFTLTVIDGAAFAGMDAYRQEMARFIDWLKSSRALRGHDGIRLPGERGFTLLRQARAEGVPLSHAMLDKLNDLAASCGVPKLG